MQPYIIAPIHEGRLGKEISPKGIVWHYTAMLPNTELSLAQVWGHVRGKGTGAHALIRRNGQIICFASWNVNANHAGGPTSGVIKKYKFSVGVRANSSTIGIELSNPGRVRKDAIGWKLAYTGLDVVRLPGDLEVVTDEELDSYTKKDSWGWVKYTNEQVAAAKKIVAIAREMGLKNKPCIVKRPDVEGNKYRDITTTWLCLRHSDMDPSRKSDPGPLWVPQDLL